MVDQTINKEGSIRGIWAWPIFLILSFHATSSPAEPLLRWPQRSLWSQSLGDALASPKVWAPTTFALMISLSGLDGQYTRFASDKRPMFAKKKIAASSSDYLAFAVLPVMTLSSLNLAKPWRPKLTLFLLSALTVSYLSNQLIKNATGRARPDQSNLASFPSSHTSLASVFSEFLAINNGPEQDSWGLWLSEAMVALVAQGRMEAGRHHLTDVLVGYSLGKFLSLFIAPMATHSTLAVSAMAFDDGFSLHLSWYEF